MIFKTESGRVGFQMKYRVSGRVRVPAGHCTYRSKGLPLLVHQIHWFAVVEDPLRKKLHRDKGIAQTLKKIELLVPQGDDYTSPYPEIMHTSH